MTRRRLPAQHDAPSPDPDASGRICYHFDRAEVDAALDVFGRIKEPYAHRAHLALRQSRKWGKRWLVSATPDTMELIMQALNEINCVVRRWREKEKADE